MSQKPWRLLKHVLPQHTDHGGVMWHGSYLLWLEEARVEALAKAGFPYQMLAARGFYMPVVNLDIKYNKALRHGDEVLLESWCFPCYGVRWPWHTNFVNKDGAKAASAKVDLVLVKNISLMQKIVRNPPDDFLLAMENLQGGP